LMLACQGNSANIVQLLLQYGADPNTRSENGYSILMAASSFGSVEVLECLLKNKANPNLTRNIDDMTALKLAKTANGDSEKEKLLIKYGAKE
jgi:ankyrin repeat protein